MIRRKPSLTRARKKRIRYIAKLCGLSKDELSQFLRHMDSQGYDFRQMESHLLGNTFFFGLVAHLAAETHSDFIDVLSTGISIYQTAKRLVKINPHKYNRVYRYCMRYL
jgi:hypothetical protein